MYKLLEKQWLRCKLKKVVARITGPLIEKKSKYNN